MRPPVGYSGGKRRLLPRILPRIEPHLKEGVTYVEPFLGMGAVYLSLRGSGFAGKAILSESNEALRDAWKYMHSDGKRLVEAAEALPHSPKTDDYFSILHAADSDPMSRAAKVLWLTNYAFGNVAPQYMGDKWSGKGTKLTSAEKWGKTFPWLDCVKRLRVVTEKLSGMPVEIHDDGHTVLSAVGHGHVVYADPPYVGCYAYRGTEVVSSDSYVNSVVSAGSRGATVVLSEARDLRGVLSGWSSDTGETVARISSQKGAEGKRAEWIYSTP